MVPMELQSIPGIYLWGIEIIKAIQRLKSPALTAILSFITEFGTASFYLPAILFLFWWIDEKKGFRLGILILLSAWINAFLKDIFKQPRPFNLDPSLGLAYEPTYGIPSGHAQFSLCFWIPIAAWFAEKKSGKKRVFIWAAAISFILLIGFTRLYLGVHFPTDLFAGWIIGALILVLVYAATPLFNKYLTDQTRVQNISAALAALAMISLYPSDRSLPALFLGFFLGYNIMKKEFPFSTQNELKKEGLFTMFFRCLIGFAGLVAIYFVLRLLLPGEGSLFSYVILWSPVSPFYELGRFIRYGLVGLWASAGAPMVFQRVGISSVDKAKKAKNEES